jgi:hypothetical protein
MAFRQNFMELTDGLVDPLQCVTIASAVMKSYRVQLIEENTIGLVYNENIHKDNYSKKAIMFMEYKMELQKKIGEPIHIKHARNGGEQKVEITKGKAKKVVSVDGYDKENNTVYEFHGCFWHGCPKCFPDRDLINPYSKKTMAHLHQQTIEKEDALAQHFTVSSKWECSWDEKENQDNVKKWLAESNFQYKEVLNPREAFMGGRTNATCLKYKCKKGEKIHYRDFTSLYPYINKYGIYPIGHPEIINKFSSTDISKYQGIIKCVVLPPRKLFHPVLPTKQGLKLVFGLCNTCMNTKSQVCNHSQEQRAITGVWTHLELQEALKKGYKILELHEVHHFKEFRKGLYAPFVNKWLKIKQEASGWPKHVKNEQDLIKYITDYEEHEDVKLDAEMIDKNPGRRATAKLILNSFWGKLGQRDNMTQDAFFDDPAKYLKLISDDKLDISDINIVSEDNEKGMHGLIHVSYTSKSGFVKPAKNTNVYHAIYTTSQARLKLFGVMDALGERVLYHDTDSVIFVQQDNEVIPEVKTGDYLGDLTDEIEDGYITEFSSAGPKDYSYKTSTGESCVKVKGFTLNYEAGQIVNMDSMLNIIEGSNPTNDLEADEYKVPIMEFVKDKKRSTIKTNNTTKEYKFQYDTRVIDWETYKTYPYGYVE